MCVCLCLTYTLVILDLIARRTDTPEESIHILTSSRRTDAGQTETLIGICEKDDRFIYAIYCIYTTMTIYI